MPNLSENVFLYLFKIMGDSWSLKSLQYFASPKGNALNSVFQDDWDHSLLQSSAGSWQPDCHTLPLLVANLKLHRFTSLGLQNC